MGAVVSRLAWRQWLSLALVPGFVAACLALTAMFSCGVLGSDPGSTKLTTPAGTVEHRGPWVPNPAPVYNITVYVQCDAGTRE